MYFFVTPMAGRARVLVGIISLSPTYLYDTMYKQQAWYTRTCTSADTTVIGDMEQGDSPECYAQIFR